MKKILIVNLRRLGDVYSSAHLINSLHASGEACVSLLVYQECRKAAVNLKNVSNLYTLDRKEIITLKSNRLFSDGFALEQLYESLSEIKNNHWDEIINFSNDLVGAYLCSYLKSSCSKITGVHFDSNRRVTTSGDWELLFNDILPTLQCSPLHFMDCYHQMGQVKLEKNGEKIITSNDYNTAAFKTISEIRKNAKVPEGQTKVIGIQLKTADSSKDIPEEVLVEFISLLLSSDDLIPLLIIAPTEEEINYATSINAIFGHKIFIAEANLEAVASVLMNVDLLVTPDTAIKHIADLTETPLIEVSLGHAPFFKQGTFNSESLVLTDLVTTRTFIKTDSNNAETTKISALDLMSSLLYFFSKTKSIRPRLSSGVALYGCTIDQLGARYHLIAGSFDAQAEAHRLMTRQFAATVLAKNELFDLYDDILELGLDHASEWAAREKEIITDLMKDLLGTLRSLIQSIENKKSARDFVGNLAKLIARAENKDSVTHLPVSLFKVKVENINSQTFIENARQVEQNLYELKADLQKFLGCIKHLEDNIFAQRKDDFINKVTETQNP